MSQGLVTLGLPMCPLMINVRRSKAMQRSIQRAMPLDFVKHLFVVKCRAFDFPEFVRRQLQIRPRMVPKKMRHEENRHMGDCISTREIVHVCSAPRSQGQTNLNHLNVDAMCPVLGHRLVYQMICAKYSRNTAHRRWRQAKHGISISYGAKTPAHC